MNQQIEADVSGCCRGNYGSWEPSSEELLYLGEGSKGSMVERPYVSLHNHFRLELPSYIFRAKLPAY